MSDTGTWLADADWGTVPEAIASFGTLGALIVALLLLRREADRDAVREQAKRAEQAHHVVAWIGRCDADLTRSLSGANVCLITSNRSGLPVYSLALTIRLVAPNGSYEHVREMNEPIWEPDFEDVKPVPARALEMWTEEKRDLGYELRVAMEFIDSANRHWQRNHDGGLREVAPVGVGHDTAKLLGKWWLLRHDMAS